MVKYIQEVLLQMDVSKYPFDISSCVSNRHLKLNMSQVKLLTFPPNLTLFAILLSTYGNSIPLPGTPLLLSWPPAHHLSMILVGVYFQNISKYVLNAPPLLTLWSKPNSSISSHWDKCQSLLLLLFFFNPFTSQQPE